MRFFDRLPDRKVLWLFPFAVFVTYLSVAPPTADDVWWRLHAGARILGAGHPVTHNGWAYRDSGRSWVNHAAGHDVIAAAVQKIAGRPGLIFIYSLPLVVLAGLLLWRSRGRDLAWAVFVPPLLAIHWALRPFVWSDVFFFAAVLWAAHLHDRRTLNLRDVLPVCGLFWLWGQLHGAVWPGLAFFLLFAVRWRSLATPRAELERLRWLALVPLCALANVQHVHGLALALRYATGDFAWLSRLTEWQAAGPVVLLFAGGFSGGFLFAWRSRGLPLPRLLPLLPLAVAGALQIRHLPWLVIGAVALLQGLGQDLPGKGPAPEVGGTTGLPARRRGLVLGALCVLLAVIPALVHADRLEDPRFHPAKLYDRMQAQCHLESPLRVFTPHAWGGSLVYRFGGKLAPFLDARNDCFSKETFDRYFRITRLADGWYDLLVSDHPDGAVLPATHPMVPELVRRGWVPGAKADHALFLVAPHRSHDLCDRIPPPGR